MLCHSLAWECYKKITTYYGCYDELEGLAWRPCCLTAGIRRLHKGWQLCLHKGLMYSALAGFLIVSPLQIFQVPPKRTEERGRQVFKYSHVCFCGLVGAAWSFLGDVFLYPQADYVRNAGEGFHFKVSDWWDESCSWLSLAWIQCWKAYSNWLCCCRGFSCTSVSNFGMKVPNMFPILHLTPLSFLKKLSLINVSSVFFSSCMLKDSILQLWSLLKLPFLSLQRTITP
jgi:hypothetical protein